MRGKLEWSGGGSSKSEKVKAAVRPFWKLAHNI